VFDLNLLDVLITVNFPKKTSVFPAPLGLVPAQIKKKEKIGTIFCPKGSLAVKTWKSLS
jgi:hypothetical protein